MSLLLTIAQSILIGMFTLAATFKFLRTRTMLQHWNEYRYPIWFLYVTASFEVLGTVGMILSFWFPDMRKYAAALFCFLMIGAIHAHLFRANHKPVMAVNAVFLLALSVFILAS